MSRKSVTRVVLLGTAGGPLPSPVRCGIAQAVAVGDRAYLVDCGSGVARQLRRARLLRHLHAVFLTHLHSDHDCDLFNLFLLGWPILERSSPVTVRGPSGLIELTRASFEAHAYDIGLRMRHAGRRDLRVLLAPQEIEVPPEAGATPERVAPPMNPFPVAEDDRVRVTAVLVDHAPVFPSFAFRFDTDDGSVVVSGDTAPCANLVALARGADLLVHEVYADDVGAHDDEGSREAELRELHLRRAHTPLSAVGRVAAEAGVRELALTHFIPGDDALPDEHWTAAVRDFDGRVTVGRDLLELAPWRR